MSSDKQKKKAFPSFKSDEEAERFVESADLSDCDFSDMKPMKTNKHRGSSLDSFLEEEGVIVTDSEKHAQVRALLDRPPETNDRLRKLMRTPPWKE